MIALRVCVAMAAIYFYAGVSEWRSLFGIAWIFVAIVVAVMICGTVSGSKGAARWERPLEQLKRRRL